MIVIAYKGGGEPVNAGLNPPEIEAAAAERRDSPLAETPAKAEADAAGDTPKKRSRKRK